MPPDCQLCGTGFCLRRAPLHPRPSPNHPPTFPTQSATHRPQSHFPRGRSPANNSTFPKLPSDLPHPTCHPSPSEPLPPGKVPRLNGESPLQSGEGRKKQSTPSPPNPPPSTLRTTISGEGPQQKIRPSPNCPPTFLTQPATHRPQNHFPRGRCPAKYSTFPIQPATHRPQSHSPRRRFPVSTGKVLFKVGKVGKNSRHLPHLIGHSSPSEPLPPGEGPRQKIRPSPNCPPTFPTQPATHRPPSHSSRGRSPANNSTFPKPPSDLPHPICLRTPLEPVSPGKVPRLNGEGREKQSTPSPPNPPPSTLRATSPGEGPRQKIRPSPNCPPTFPTQPASEHHWSRFLRGRSPQSGEGSPSQRGKSSSKWGRSKKTVGTFPTQSATHRPPSHFLRGRSPAKNSTFPKTPSDLPHCLRLFVRFSADIFPTQRASLHPPNSQLARTDMIIIFSLQHYQQDLWEDPAPWITVVQKCAWYGTDRWII